MRLIPLALATSLALGAVACKKDEPAQPVPTPATAEPAAAPAADAAPATPPPATPSPTAAAPSGPSALKDPCPMPGEDPAACPGPQAKVDDDIQVGHVLIGWDGSLPGEKVGRTKDQALQLATQIAHEARKPGTDFVKLIWQHSQDPGPGVYKVTPDMRGRYVPQFTAMALTLGVGQVDVVETRFGYHVMKRVPFDFVPPEKPLEKVMTDACPAEGEDPAACPSVQDPKPTSVEVSHILIGYAGSLPGKDEKRTKEEAKAFAIKLAHDSRKKGADFQALMKQHSQDPGPGTYPVDKDAGLVPAFKQLSMQLGVGQVDVVETNFGYHVIRRNK